MGMSGAIGATSETTLPVGPPSRIFPPYVASRVRANYGSVFAAIRSGWRPTLPDWDGGCHVKVRAPASGGFNGAT